MTVIYYCGEVSDMLLFVLFDAVVLVIMSVSVLYLLYRTSKSTGTSCVDCRV